MKKFAIFGLVLALVAGFLAPVPAHAYTITKTSEERFNSADTDTSFRRVIGYFTLDSSHPAEGETLLPSQLGMASFSRVSIGPAGPDGAWPANAVTAGSDQPRRFAFDYTANRFYVLTTAVIGAGAVAEISGPVTYDLSYLTRVPFEAVGPIS